MNEQATLGELIDKYGTDKTIGTYTPSYEKFFKPKRDKVKSLLEVGIGTLQPNVSSSFVGNLRYYPEYKPGGSLRAWRDYFSNAQIYGVDIAEDCMFEEERIKTFLFDSTSKSYCNHYLKDLTFDVIIDDGNHDPSYQIKTLENLLPKVNPGGTYVIEDVGGYGGDKKLLIDYQEEFLSLTKGCALSNKGNHIFISKPIKEVLGNFTLVSGLWNINRTDRDFEEYYLSKFIKLLDTPASLILFLPPELEDLVWEHRERYNTLVHPFDLKSLKNLYKPHWDTTQRIRKDSDWLNSTGENGWLKNSPQATLEYFSPIVMSKLFMLHDASIYNPFNSEYFYWIDASIEDEIALKHLTQENFLVNLVDSCKSFSFLSYPIEGTPEICGFPTSQMNQLAGEKVEFVCSGEFFGGHKTQISQANASFYSHLQSTLNRGHLGRESNIFTIMSYREPYLYKRFELDTSSELNKFTQAVIDNKVILTNSDLTVPENVKTNTSDLSKIKTNLYVLTFNFPEQLEHTLTSMKKVPEWLSEPYLVLLDNSTDVNAKIKNQKIAKDNNFEYIDLEGNKGICGGRQAAAEHFHNSDADYYFFFEDDMTSNPPEEEGKFCRNGFRKYIPNLYKILHKIIIKEDFDYLKLSFTEVYWDNDIQTSWYNVPQDVRTKFWPHYDKLPVTGVDPHAPRTEFDKIGNVDGVAYISGDVTYTNWPMIMSRKGNQKVFIDIKWDHPFEQTWMSNVFQMQKEGKIKAGVLLASPIWHERIKHYKPEERREN